MVIDEKDGILFNTHLQVVVLVSQYIHFRCIWTASGWDMAIV